MPKCTVTPIEDPCAGVAETPFEMPIFRLTEKEARPTHGQFSDGASRYLLSDYVVDFKPRVGARVKITAQPWCGFPTVRAMRVLIAVIERCSEESWSSKEVPITLESIAKAIEHEGPLEDLRDDLEALIGINFQRKSSTHCEGWSLIESARTTLLVPSEENVIRFPSRKPSAKPDETLPAWVHDWVGRMRDGGDHIALGGKFEALRRNYRPISLRYLNGLTPLAQRLCAYLRMKTATGCGTYSENAKHLGCNLPLLGCKSAKQAQGLLEPALEELASPRGGQRFLDGYDRDAAMLNVTFTAEPW
jgi:hypothetical protein